MTLADSQERLAAALLSGEMRDVADRFDGRLRSPLAGLALYRESMLASLTAVLGASFPVVRRRLGDAAFRRAAQDFIHLHPPRSPVLREYGREFPAFLSADERPTEERPVAAIARREWGKR